MLNVPYRLIYLIIWSLAGGTALEGPGPLNGWSLIGRLGSLRVVLEVLWLGFPSCYSLASETWLQCEKPSLPPLPGLPLCGGLYPQTVDQALSV